MILHDLLSTLKTSVCRCMLFSPGSCDMPVTTWLERPTLRDGRCVKKFSDLLCLTECRFYGHLEEDAHLYPNLSMKSRLAQLDNGHFSKLLKLQNETHKKQERSFTFLPCCVSKRCLLSCMVGLTRLTTPRGWSTIRNTDPVGVKG